MKHFSEDNTSVYEANVKAQQIAFSPIAFQASRLLCKLGVLEFVQKTGKKGCSLQDIQEKYKKNPYGIKVLLESGLGIGLLIFKNNRYFATKIAYMMLFDPMTKINMAFTHDVCYQGMFDLDKSILHKKPVGLKMLGKWKTIYEGLSKLKPNIRKSWFDFDHYYSDLAFPSALPIVFKSHPKTLLDIGGNTGKWAIMCAAFDKEVSVTIADLKGQLAMARTTIKKNRLTKRINTHPIDILNTKLSLPKGYDAIWMSQFLDCFSTKQITSILRRARKAMSKASSLYILETYWDRQENETAAFCLQQTSLYFTCLANGNSQMYHSDDMKKCIEDAGLRIAEDYDRIGRYHTLFRCVPK